MALGATVYKATVDISDADRHYYAEHKLTLACHPSETEARMMVRLLAFCLRAHPDLEFTRGLSTADEPDLWQKDPTGQIVEWIDVGQPALDRLKKARGRAGAVIVYSFGRGRDQWWQSEGSAIDALARLQVVHLSDEDVLSLAALAQKTMTLSVCISDGIVYLSTADATLTIQPRNTLDSDT